MNLRNGFLVKLCGKDKRNIDPLLPYYRITDEEAKQICNGQTPKPYGENVNIEKLITFLDEKIAQLSTFNENDDIFKSIKINVQNISKYVEMEGKMKNYSAN